ncbi:fumarylacetoacetate hydrolase family protein [Actinoplanes sp. Pm04-4]|uniref:Fumarylacetoacetate hydrolase family protein n=1 Tax=Paractinoplanes pyxinae TaxID=2997416 RepID=A0ABT4BCG2_9ACTN|nr:fumarylacetoacetate hydrolase family protein [Actinoplanes pyxinae]MCY1143682.1 fumarylacetoacetate hydrolase family protein [Actinoplanes pyxinae]
MRIYNLDGRLALGLPSGGAADVATASEGRFGPEVQAVYDRWAEFIGWARTYDGPADQSVDEHRLGPPVPRPPQIFGIGLNYRDHADEAGLAVPDRPMVFTKFPASITGPYGTITLPPGSVDFETELVVVIGVRAERVPAARAWEHVAGFTAGQDLSERELQFAGSPPQQFSLGKSFTGFAPIGPALVTVDEFTDREDVPLGCEINGEKMQDGTTADLIFGVPRLVEYLSAIVPLLPGDLLFTGTPAGIGWARTPRRLLHAGDELVTRIDTIGTMRHTFI